MPKQQHMKMPGVRLPAGRQGQAIDYDKELNAEQLAVVKGGDGPCVVIAGAGSGKTRTIVYRVAWLIEHGVDPSRILLLTFTNKAAGEMMTRIGQLLQTSLPMGSGGVWGGTFHSVANRILRAYAARIGFTPGFTILDEEDSKDLMKATMRSLGFPVDGKKFPSPAVIREVVSWTTNAMRPFDETVLGMHPRFEPMLADLRRVADEYDLRKRKSNAMDFDDLLSRLHRLLLEDRAVREQVASRFRYVLVDEYQDTNPLQAAIVDLLAGPERNVLVVGDDAQSIYSFRAADVRNILDFPKRWPGAKLFKLETNYRSTPDILDLANDVISRNAEQYPKTLRAVVKPMAKPLVVPTPSASAEALYVVAAIKDRLDEGVPPEDIAVLFRATFHSQTLEFELMRQGLEYEYRGGLKFFDRAHVKDVLAFMRIAHNFADEAAWLRVLGLQEGIGEVTAGKVMHLMREAGSLGKAVLMPVEQALGPRVARGWRDLRGVLETLHQADGRPAEMVKAVLDSSYVEYLENEYPNHRERLEDIEQLAFFAGSYASAGDLLADVTLDSTPVRGTRNAAPRIVLSTIHQAKGLEWDSVFLIHLTNSGFPNRRAVLEDGGLEEERRLFYVACTRAKRHLVLSYPASTSRDELGIEQPSCFLEEADPNCLDLKLCGGSVGGRWSSHGGDDADSGGFYEDESIDVDADPSDPFAQIKGRMKGVRKSFLRDV